VSICTRSGQGLLALLDQVLDFSKSQSGRMTLNVAPLDLHALIAEVGGILRADAADKKISLDCLADAGDVWVYRTPILHASDRAANGRRRRVLQVDYSGDDLPDGLSWFYDQGEAEGGPS
jgi:signal transduction histidine kinase